MKTDERSLVEAEKAELLTDVKPNIVPIRSWDVDRLICHAQSEADKAIEKLLLKSSTGAVRTYSGSSRRSSSAPC